MRKCLLFEALPQWTQNTWGPGSSLSETNVCSIFARACLFEKRSDCECMTFYLLHNYLLFLFVCIIRLHSCQAVFLVSGYDCLFSNSGSGSLIQAFFVESCKQHRGIGLFVSGVFSHSSPPLIISTSVMCVPACTFFPSFWYYYATVLWKWAVIQTVKKNNLKNIPGFVRVTTRWRIT